MWNTEAVQIVERDGKTTSGVHVYAASKTLAERAMWNFMAIEKPSFDLSSIMPVWVFGPYIHQVSCKDERTFSWFFIAYRLK